MIDRPIPKCLKCGSELDDFMPIKVGMLPKEGDVSVCLYCGSIAIYTGNLDLREATEKEMAEAEKLRDLRLALIVIKFWREKTQ
jgi:hypothetical protein